MGSARRRRAAGAARARGRVRQRADIRRTAHGIPHIKAKSYRSLGYGYGYAFAQDNICPIAEAYVTVNAQRSRYFGPDGSYLQRGNGQRANNLNSDFFWQQVIDSGVVDRLLAQPPPKGPKREILQGVRGYVAGYNRFVRDVGGPNGISDPACKGAEWVRPITEKDAFLRFYQLVLLASQSVAIDGIGAAEIPLDAPLGEFQFVTRSGVRIPIHGGPGADGNFNALNVTWAEGRGPQEVEHGTSYVQVVGWRAGRRGRCPDARTILTYSQSTNPNSPFFADQTRLYSDKRWVPVRFCGHNVRRHTVTKTTVRSGGPTRVVRGRRARR